MAPFPPTDRKPISLAGLFSRLFLRHSNLYLGAWRMTSTTNLIADRILVTVALVLPFLAAILFFLSSDDAFRSVLQSGPSAAELQKTLGAMSPERMQQLLASEKHNLAIEPLNLQALSNIALLESISADESAAEKAVILAASRTRRDSVVQALAFNLATKANDYGAAIEHASAALSVSPTLKPIIFPAFLKLLNEDKATKELAGALATKPAWRSDLITWLTANDQSEKSVFALFDAMRQIGSTPTTAETRTLIAAEINRKDYQQAYYFWLDSLDQSQLRKVAGLFDGQFEYEPKNQFFDWNLEATPNAEIALLHNSGQERKNFLQVSFYNNTSSFQNVYQYLFLPAGNYAFTGLWSSHRLKTTGGLQWSVTCLDPLETLGTSMVFSDVSEPEIFSFEFKVPSENCQFQVLKLANASAAVLDLKMDGIIQFSNFNLEARP